MNFELFDPCQDPAPEDWEDFRKAEGLTALWAYDVIAAASRASWARPLLAIAREEGRIAGAVGAVYLGLRLPGSARAPRPRREPLLLDVRLPAHSYGPTWHFRTGVPVREALRLFERAAAKELGWGLAGVTYRMLTEPEHVARRGAILRDSPGGTTMPILWSSVDGWLGSLDKKRRSELRRRNRRIAEELAVTAAWARTDLDAAEMAEMNRKHTERLAVRHDPRSPLPPDYFASLLGRDDVYVISYRDEGRLLAYSIVFDHETSPLHGTYAALRPEEGGRGHLYFDAYLQALRRVTEDGKKELHGGRGAVDIKQELGFGYVPMSFAVVPRWSMG